MNIASFKVWLINSGSSPKVASDIVSRLKKINIALVNSPKASSIDEEFGLDKCKTLLESFKNRGVNNLMLEYDLHSLPISKNSMYTFTNALKKYIIFTKCKY